MRITANARTPPSLLSRLFRTSPEGTVFGRKIDNLLWPESHWASEFSWVPAGLPLDRATVCRGQVGTRAPGEKRAHALGEPAVILRSQKSCGHRFVSGALLAAFALIAIMLPASPASAQNFFEALFGRRSWTPPANAYADPNRPVNPFGQRAEPREGGTAYCVRTCDGRFFPIQRHAGVSPAQAC